MSRKEKRSYLEEITKRYHLGSRKQKKQILDEFCAVCHYNRKYAIQLLNKSSVTPKHKKKGRKTFYKAVDYQSENDTFGPLLELDPSGSAALRMRPSSQGQSERMQSQTPN